MSDQKPCPFCGGSEIGESIARVRRVCETCGATGPCTTSDLAERDALWNTRPVEEALRAEVERLTGLLAPKAGMTFDEAKEHVSERWGDVLRRLGE